MKILAINYSQTGQLHEIVDNFIEPFDGHEVERVHVRPVDPFPFPWDSDTFFDAMPETVLGETMPIELPPFGRTDYDLIVLGYQPWFLSPSPIVTSLLKDERFVPLLEGTPVVTLVGARNMWLNAHEKVKSLLSAAGANWVGNVPFIDHHNNLVSVVTIFHWLLKGRKDRKWGIFPRPGVAQEDIDRATDFGRMAVRCLEEGRLHDLQREMRAFREIPINTSLMFVESRAGLLFQLWASHIKARGEAGGNRLFWIRFFKYYLLFAIFVVSPVVLLFYNLLVRPFTGASIQRKKEYFRAAEPNLTHELT